MTCGEKGHKNKAGKPCHQWIEPDQPACIWHGSTPEERAAIAREGSRKAQFYDQIRKSLPGTYVVEFTSRDKVLLFVEDMAKKALTSKVDLRRLKAAGYMANVALQAFKDEDQKQLIDTLSRLEYGGAASLLMARMAEGQAKGRRVPLPIPKALIDAELVTDVKELNRES